jgi:hypothetical protein
MSSPFKLILVTALLASFCAPLLAREHIPYSVLSTELCYGRVQRGIGNGEAQEKGARYVEIVVAKDMPHPVCIAFGDVARQILRTCPIGSKCWIDADVPGDDGIAKIYSIYREK